MRFVLFLLASTALAQQLPEKMRTDIALVQRDIRELERDYYNLKLQYDEQSKKILDKGKDLSDKMLALRKQATEVCTKAGKDLDEQNLVCKEKAKDERSNK